MHCRTRALVVATTLVLSSCTGTSTPDATPETAPETTASSTTTDGPAQSLGEPEDPDPPERLGPAFSKMTEPGVGGRITSIVWDDTSTDRLLIGGDMLGIAITEDLGATWTNTTGLASWEIGDIAATRSGDGRLWTGSLSGPQSSVDDGRTWALSRDGMPAISDSQYSLAIETILVDPTNPDTLFAFNGNQRNWAAPGSYRDGIWTGDGSVWTSTDSGTTWTALGIVAPGANVRSAVLLGGQPSMILAATDSAGARISLDGGATWGDASTGLPHSDTYDVLAHPTDPSQAWIAVGSGPLGDDGRHVPGGIWRTDDGAVSWTAVNDGLNIVGNQTIGDTAAFHQIVSSPADPDRLYTSNVAPGQAAVYRSDDGGSTWNVIADGATIRPNPYEGALRAFDIAVHPADADRVAIGSDDALLASVDGGVNWSDLTTIEDSTADFFQGRGYSGLVSTDVVFDPADTEREVLLGFDGGNFIQSLDGGTTWRRSVQDVSAWGGAIEAAWSPNAPDRIYVLLGQFSNFRGIGVSDDGGATFDLVAGAAAGLPEIGNIGAGTAEQGPRGLAVSSDDGADRVFAAIGGQLFGSTDGSVFEAVPGLTDVRDVAVTADGTTWIATAASVMRSTDGVGFDPVPAAPVGATHLFTSAAEPDHVYVVSFRQQDGGVSRWHGDGWETVFEDPFAHGFAVDPTDPTRMAVVTSEPAFHDVSSATGVYLSIDGGRNWAVMNDGLPMTRLRTAEFDPHEPDRLVVGTTGRGFYEVSFSQATGSAPAG